MSLLTLQIDMIPLQSPNKESTVKQAAHAIKQLLNIRKNYRVLDPSYPAVGSLVIDIWSREMTEVADQLKAISDSHPAIELLGNIIDRKELMLPSLTKYSGNHQPEQV